MGLAVAGLSSPACVATCGHTEEKLPSDGQGHGWQIHYVCLFVLELPVTEAQAADKADQLHAVEPPAQHCPPCP
jgi:hypothetical protein